MRFGKPLLACALSLLMVFGSLVPCFAKQLPDANAIVNNDVKYNGFTDTLSGAVIGTTLVDYASSASQSSPPAFYSSSSSGFWYMSPIVGSQYAYPSSYPPTRTVTAFPELAFLPYDQAIDSPVTWYFSYGACSSVGGSDGSAGSNLWRSYLYDGRTTAIEGAEYTDFTFLSRWEPSSPTYSDKNGTQQWLSRSWQYSMRVDVRPIPDQPITQISISSSNMWAQFNTSNSSYGLFLPWSFVIPTSAYLDIYDQIYDRLVNIDNNLAQYLPQIYSALQSIVTNLEGLNTDTDTIIEILNNIKDIDSQSLTVLQSILTTSQSIDTTVKQIYATMVSEVAGASDLSNNAQSATNEINTVDVQETAWQNQMSSNFTQLELDNFSLGILGSGLSLVGNMFTSIWSAFGGWSILFTFPLVFGISLLVIGRISKSGGKGSSRDKDKGDDG